RAEASVIGKIACNDKRCESAMTSRAYSCGASEGSGRITSADAYRETAANDRLRRSPTIIRQPARPSERATARDARWSPSVTSTLFSLAIDYRHQSLPFQS